LASRNFSIFLLNTLFCAVVSRLVVLLSVSSLDMTSSMAGQVMSGTRGAFLRILRHICSYLGKLFTRLLAMHAPVGALFTVSRFEN
jgi:hypothetical protein